MSRLELQPLSPQSPGLFLAADGVLYCAHRGTSMNPTLCAQDMLEIRPYAGRSIQVGDVVVFPSPEGEQFIVHRVIHASADSLRTQGDNNQRPDPWQLVPGQVVGQVIAAWRGEERRLIPGGQAGQQRVRRTRWGQTFNHTVSRWLRPAYHFLASTGWLRPFCPRHLRPQVVCFQGRQGQQLRLCMGRRMVGHYDARLCRWNIRPPFRLFVDERDLRDQW